MAEKKKAGPIKYFMNKNEFNAICNLMYIIGEKLKAGRYTTFAKYMLKKLLRYNIVMGNLDADDCPIRVCLYDNEAEMLLSIYTVYVTQLVETEDKLHDYISDLKENKQKKKIVVE